MLVRSKFSVIGVAFIAALIFSGLVSAANNPEGQQNAELILKIQAMQREISSLRNELERQGYQIKNLQRSSSRNATKVISSTNSVNQDPVINNNVVSNKADNAVALGEIAGSELNATINTSQTDLNALQEDSSMVRAAEASSTTPEAKEVSNSALIDFPVSPQLIEAKESNEISRSSVGTAAVSPETLNTQPNISKHESEILEKGDSSIKTDLKELDLYNKGIEKLNAEEYKAASSIFSSQIQNFPKGQKTADAYYWLAESFYIMGDYESAAKSYQALGTIFPANPRTPKALMKAVGAQQESGQIESAKITLLMLIKNYPSSNEASEAKQKYSSLL